MQFYGQVLRCEYLPKSLTFVQARRSTHISTTSSSFNCGRTLMAAPIRGRWARHQLLHHPLQGHWCAAYVHGNREQLARRTASCLPHLLACTPIKTYHLVYQYVYLASAALSTSQHSFKLTSEKERTKACSSVYNTMFFLSHSFVGCT